MTHTCVKIDYQWLSLWLGTCLGPSHYLNQWRLIVNWALRNNRPWNSNQNSINSRYIVVQYSMIFHTVQHLPMWTFGQTLNSRKTPKSHPNGRAMGVFRELFGEKWPRDIGSALYNNSHFKSLVWKCRVQNGGHFVSVSVCKQRDSMMRQKENGGNIDFRLSLIFVPLVVNCNVSVLHCDHHCKELPQNH